MEVMKSVNSIYEKIILAVENDIYPLVDKSMDLIYQFQKGSDFYKGYIKLVEISNFLVFAILTVILVTQVTRKIISFYTGEDVQCIFKTILKFVIVYLLAINSNFIVEYVSEIFEIVYEYVDDAAKNLVNRQVCFKNLLDEANIKSNDKNDLFTINGLIKSIICYGSVTILISNSVRFIAVFIVYACLPVIIMFIGVGTKKIQKIKLLFLLLVTPIVIKVIIIIPFLLKGKNEFLFSIAVLGTFNIITKINNYLKEVVL